MKTEVHPNRTPFFYFQISEIWFQWSSCQVGDRMGHFSTEPKASGRIFPSLKRSLDEGRVQPPPALSEEQELSGAYNKRTHSLAPNTNPQYISSALSCLLPSIVSAVTEHLLPPFASLSLRPPPPCALIGLHAIVFYCRVQCDQALAIHTPQVRPLLAHAS